MLRQNKISAINQATADYAKESSACHTAVSAATADVRMFDALWNDTAVSIAYQ